MATANKRHFHPPMGEHVCGLQAGPGSLPPSTSFGKLSTVSFFSFIKRPLAGEDPGQYLLQTCSSLRSGGFFCRGLLSFVLFHLAFMFDVRRMPNGREKQTTVKDTTARNPRTKGEKTRGQVRRTIGKDLLIPHFIRPMDSSPVLCVFSSRWTRAVDSGVGFSWSVLEGK